MKKEKKEKTIIKCFKKIILIYLVRNKHNTINKSKLFRQKKRNLNHSFQHSVERNKTNLNLIIPFTLLSFYRTKLQLDLTVIILQFAITYARLCVYTVQHVYIGIRSGQCELVKGWNAYCHSRHDVSVD